MKPAGKRRDCHRHVSEGNNVHERLTLPIAWPARLVCNWNFRPGPAYDLRLLTMKGMKVKKTHLRTCPAFTSFMIFMVNFRSPSLVSATRRSRLHQIPEVAVEIGEDGHRAVGFFSRLSDEMD